MARGRNRTYFAITFLISCIPTCIGIYTIKQKMFVPSTILLALSILCMAASTFLFLGYKTVKHGTPFLFQILTSTSQSLAPLARYLSKTTLIGPLFSVMIRFLFFVSFIILLMSDQLVRTLFCFMVGKHPTKRNYSVTTAMDPRLELFDPRIAKTKYLENSDLFKQRKQMSETNKQSRALTALLKRPKYSVSLAYTLSVASKLVYEDVDVIKYELQKAGFDVDRTFKPIAYKNICAFIVEKDNDILLVFRGTNPLNIQNYLTNMTVKLTQISSIYGEPMGGVHKGFWEAMGMQQNKNRSDHIIRIELTNTSIYHTIVSALQATIKIVHFLTTNLFHHVKEPIDSSWVGSDIDIRTQSMYALAEQHILNLIQKYPSKKRKRLFITGHSLGGALSTIFVGKMLQSKSPLLDYFAGLYTYGQPKIGDAEFSKIFSPSMTSKIFRHVYNNDIVPRIHFSNYHTPPGCLVYIDSAYNITIYPPNPYTNEPVPVRNISFLHLSGLLNRFVIRRLTKENRIRILFRVLFPFFLNDHFPCDYSESLKHGHVNWVIMGAGVGGSEQDKATVVDVQDN